MARREFQFVEGTASKFWAIDLAGAEFSVHWGRIGTAGQAQVKKFGSEAEAKKQHEKLIEEKTGKGYSEVKGAAADKKEDTAAVKAAKEKAAHEAAAEEPPAEKPAPKTKGGPAVAPPEKAAPLNSAAAPVAASSARKINLTPAKLDWHRKDYFDERPAVAGTRPLPKPFDVKAALESLRDCTSNDNSHHWPWEKPGLPPEMTREEAHFWFEAIFAVMEITDYKDRTGANVLPKLEHLKFDGKVTLKDYEARLATMKAAWNSPIAIPAAHLLTPAEMVELAAPDGWTAFQFVEALQRRVLPWLDEREKGALRAQIRARVLPSNWNDQKIPGVFFLAMELGMVEELRPVVMSWADKSGQTHYKYSFVHAFADAKFVEHQIRRLEINIQTPELLRRWIALTQFGGLDYACDQILALTNKKEAEDMVKTLGIVLAPEAAPHMLRLQQESRAPAPAREWLEQHPDYAIPGLIPVAEAKGKMADAAIDYYLDARRRGLDAQIRGMAPANGRLAREVLAHAQKQYDVIDAAQLPASIKIALEKAQKLKAVKGFDPATPPPVVVGDARLDGATLERIAAALAASVGADTHPVITAVKAAATKESLDAFSWKLFENWLTSGADSKGKWAMFAVGYFGSDAAALKLTPLIRAWPGESQHARAVNGLECLRLMGTDTALMCLNGIAQKLKFQGLKNKAKEMMEAIAKDKGLTRAQLEDRIVPDCDLDERGTRVFDFGPRQFRMVLGPGLKPMVKGGENKLKSDLPVPNSKDDPAQSAQAVEDWKLVKKQVKEVAKQQAARLEQAMVTGRRWPMEEFKLLLVQHPLMVNLVRLLVWAGYDAQGKLLATFRVTEEGEFFGPQDNAADLKNAAAIGIPHPLELTPEQRSAWGILGDYEIIPPFDQLGRAVYSLEKGEEKTDSLKRWDKVAIPGASLVGALERNGWVRGTLQDHGDFHWHSKTFYNANLTAIVAYDPGLYVGQFGEAPDQIIEEVYFLKGLDRKVEYQKAEQEKLGEVHPIVISEVLKDVSSAAAKSEG